MVMTLKAQQPILVVKHFRVNETGTKRLEEVLVVNILGSFKAMNILGISEMESYGMLIRI